MPTRHPAPRHFDAPRYRDFYRTMWRIRLFEEAAIRAVADKLVLGAIHPSIGQEAVAVGVCGNLAREDALLSTHRGHGHTLAKGADSLAMMRELFGREGGTCHGKGGSMHIADFGVGMLGANGVVGANIVIAVGAAHAIRLKRENRIVCCLFGDGAINRGPPPPRPSPSRRWAVWSTSTASMPASSAAAMPNARARAAGPAPAGSAR
ncbi:MAG: thiamine pyrophosphate-dependent enzyme, partial [Betaproteobacteria bacterium]